MAEEAVDRERHMRLWIRVESRASLQEAILSSAWKS